MHGSQDQHHGDDSGGSRNGLNLGKEESGKKPPKQQRKLSVDPDDGPGSPSRLRRPSAVNVQDPDGKSTALYQDNYSAASEEATGGRHALYSHPSSGSEHSFASIKAINDLGFERLALARPTTIDQGSGSLHPRNVRSESSTSLVHSNNAETQGSNAQDRLAKGLRAAYRKSAASDKDAEFIPIRELENILTRETIQDVLKQKFPELQSAESEAELDELTHNICPSRRRLFALLVLNMRVECIKCFVKCGVTDRDFPFAQAPDSSESAAVHPRGDVGYQRPLSCCFEEWKPSELEWFLLWQHVVASPFFDLGPGSLYLYILPNDSVLPFLESKPTGEGGHANVWKVLIHPAHHNFPTQPGTDKQYFAVKTLHTRQREEYEREVEVLNRFSGQHEGHPHLIRLLLTYQYKDSYHLVFPCANGNLRDFWESVGSPQRTKDEARWMLAQCFGIADGLQQIHGDGDARLSPSGKNTGRHGDIKPENILWFENHNGSVNHLLICDFGLSRFHSYQSQSVDELPGWSPSYRPPECDLYRLRISVKYDIWTLGCLLLDFLTWYLRGWNAVDTEFIDARLKDEGWPGRVPPNSTNRCLYEDKFYKQSNDGINVSAQLKPSVIKWMEELHNLDYCPKFAHDLLEIIHKGLLHPDKRQRWDCAKVVTELGKIRYKCDSDEAYCINPSVWEGGPLETFTVSYRLNQVESLNSIMANNAQQQTGAHSPRSLSPVSRSSGTRTPPPPEELQDADSPAAAPVDTITTAGIPEPTSPAEPTDQAPGVTQVSPLPGLNTRSQSGLLRYSITPGTTMDTSRTATDPSQPLLALPPSGDGGKPQPVGRGNMKRAWVTCKKGVRRLGCCFPSG